MGELIHSHSALCSFLILLYSNFIESRRHDPGRFLLRAVPRRLGLAQHHVEKQDIFRPTVSTTSSIYSFSFAAAFATNTYRTHDVYEDIAPINPYALAALPSTNQRAFVSKWAQNTSIARECQISPARMSEATIISNSDIKDNQKFDVTSVSSSTVCTPADKVFLASFQIEAIPPYPKRNPTNDLFNLRNQICRPGNSTQVL